ncbi:MAG TPA: hypothetical protein PKA16_10595 [Ottowia sp.]|uniref:hypothetical protein n=1 Tax=Ottowia sp. TaxID=1898956 RepID=UPI002C4FA032|nr:hypothetical protein [Ottowia sp.]HMN21826.1 hypothetical protein [Ottowia sp.]
MRPAVAAFAVLLLMAGCAQPVAAPETSVAALAPPAGLAEADFDAWLKGERTRLAQQRESARQRHAADELACWRRFAVNDCLREARLRQRDVLAAVQRDELALNALERERRTAARLRAIEEKNR